MAGTVKVSNTGDWLTPYAVEVAIEGRRPSTSRFSAQARTQQYALAMAEEHDLALVYDLDVSPLPTNKGNAETQREAAARRAREFPHRHTKPCAKCHVAKPLADFRVQTRRNASNGVETHFGWAAKCLDCEDAHGQ